MHRSARQKIGSHKNAKQSLHIHQSTSGTSVPVYNIVCVCNQRLRVARHSLVGQDYKRKARGVILSIELQNMPRVRWSETLEHQDDDVSSLNNNRVQRSSLKPPSMGKARRPKAAIRKERQRREEAKDDGAEAWREWGKLYRAKLIMKDEESGGDAFTLSNECEIEKYYDVGERVSVS
jgi:hypothetical protein